MTEFDRRHVVRRDWTTLMPEILDYISMGYGRGEIASIMKVPIATMDYQLSKVLPGEQADGKAAKQKKRSKRYLGAPTQHVLQIDRAMTKKQLSAAKAAIPKDTRDVSARLCGEPLPGRSALDQIQDEIRAIEADVMDISVTGLYT